jgi:hypothetical protein
VVGIFADHRINDDSITGQPFLNASAGGFPAVTGNVPFLIKDVVLFAVSVYLLKQETVAEAADGSSCLFSVRRTVERRA